MKLSLIKCILNGFPEALLLLYVSVSLLGFKLSIREYIKVGIINISILWVVRDYFDLFGLHIFIGLITMISLIRVLVQDDIKKVIISTFISFIILYIGETSILSLMVNLFELNIEEMNYSLKLYLLMAYASKIPLIITVLAIHRFNIKIFNK
jgi:hypothetical protein